MPRTERDFTSILSIALHDAKACYYPGDIIVGNVMRHEPLVSTHATITITFCGRAKPCPVFRSAKPQQVRHTRLSLVDDTLSSQLLHSGPCHVPPGGEQPLAVPFTVRIPTHVSSNALLSGDTTEPHLPPTGESLAGQRLPSSMVAPSLDGSVEPFVEFYLEAKMTGANGFTTTETAMLPIAVRNHADGAPITDYKVKLWRHACAISSPRLSPGMDDAKLTVKDTLKKVFSTGSVPKFSFRLEVGVPSVFQIDSPHPVPLTLRAFPIWDLSSADIKDTLPKIKLKSMRMRLESKTAAIVNGLFQNNTSVKIDIPFDQVLCAPAPRQQKTFFVPCTDEWPPLDLGRELSLRIEYAGPSFTGSRRSVSGAPDPRLVSPTTETYNFKVSHMLSWVARVEIAGEGCRVEGSQPVVILPPAAVLLPPQELPVEPQFIPDLPPNESWIQPPAEGDAPPTFTQVQKEDMIANGGKAGHASPKEGEASGA